MVHRKVMKINSNGVRGISIPNDILDELGLNTENSYVNIEKVGNSIHVNKVQVVL